MTILVTGSTGKTGHCIVDLLRDCSVITVSRQPGYSVYFDWEDPATYILPFEAARDTVMSVQLIIPTHIPTQNVHEFIDLAVSKGVKRFVLMSGSLDIPEDPIQGPIRAHLRNTGLPFCVLRPSRFFENFSEMPESIRDHDKIVSATGTASIGFVSCEDIARVAVDCLLTEAPHCAEHIIVGPELLSFDRVAECFSDVLRRSITHESISVAAQKDSWFGLPDDFIKLMGFVEEMTAAGGEEAVYATETKIIGKKTLTDFVQENVDLWTSPHVDL
ncbi:NAD(P)-binding protein [Mycena sanguinolenta]|uniref:NAD(P)-binding protein n=1 Tax=Mycena sanguinolenta TaxID=230812 RepID=A0A8H6ZE88_9AGAR|nr:NAD(P)-binding protein [Mycena sanguinolenta]